MIVVNSLTGAGYSQSLYFSNRLVEGLRSLGESVFYSFESALSVGSPEYNRQVAVRNPDVILNISCKSDVTRDGLTRGFSIESNKKTALLDTFVTVLKSKGFTPSDNIGYKITYKDSVAKLCEVSISLGYIDNTDDAALLSDEILDSTVKDILTIAYAPPVKTIEVDERVLNSDPYFTEGVWDEISASKTSADTGIVEEIVFNRIPFSVLRLDRATAHTSPYYWSCPVTLSDIRIKYTLILSVRNTSDTETKIPGLAVSIGDIQTDIPVDSRQWKTVSLVFGINSVENTLQVGISSVGTLEIASVWVCEAPILGSIDDPIKVYSLFPKVYIPGKGSIGTDGEVAYTTPIGTGFEDPISMILQGTTSFLGKASELYGVLNTLKTIQNINLKKPDVKGLVESSKGLTKVMSDNIDLKNPKFIDPVTIKIDYASLEASLEEINRGTKKAATQRAINTQKSMERALVAYKKDISAAQQEAKDSADISVQYLKDVNEEVSK